MSKMNVLMTAYIRNPLVLETSESVLQACADIKWFTIPEVLNDKKLGYLIPSKDVDVLAAAMFECASKSQQDRLLMGHAARDTVERFYSHDIASAELEKLYKEELLKAGGK